MRLDLFLVTSRLIKRRSLAQEFCEKGFVRVNGVEAKSSKETKEGDLLEIARGGEVTVVHILRIPETKQVSKDTAASLFEILSVEKKIAADQLL